MSIHRKESTTTLSQLRLCYKKYNNLRIVASNYVTLCDTLSYSLNALLQATHCIIGSDVTSGTRRVVTAFII